MTKTGKSAPRAVLWSSFFCLGSFIIILASVYLAPHFLCRYFNGPDGMLWLEPFLVWMGVLCCGYVFIAFFVKGNSLKSSAFILGFIITFFAGMFLFVSIQRFLSGLQFTETYNEIMSIRLAQGENIYPDPAVYPAGTIYTPFYFMLSSLFYMVFPQHYCYGRLVSILSVIATCLFVYSITRMRSSDRKTGILAAALFLATYAPMNMLYDQCYVDTLLMLCTSAACYFFLRNTSRDDTLALLFGGLACFTKQSGLLPFIVILTFCIGARRSWRVYIPVAVWVVAGIVLVVMTQGWAIRYLMEYPSAHGFRKSVPGDLLFNFIILQTALWIGVLYSLLKRKKDFRFFLYCSAVLLSSLAGILKNGGYMHALFPVEPLLCIGAAELLYRRKILFACQILVGLYNPFGALYAWSAYHAADKEIVTIARQTSEDVWIPMETYLYPRTGKQDWDNFCALFTLLWAGYPTQPRLLDALREQRFEYILIRKNSLERFDYFDPAIRTLLAEKYLRQIQGNVVVFRRKS